MQNSRAPADIEVFRAWGSTILRQFQCLLRNIWPCCERFSACCALYGLAVEDSVLPHDYFRLPTKLFNFPCYFLCSPTKNGCSPGYFFRFPTKFWSFPMPGIHKISMGKVKKFVRQHQISIGKGSLFVYSPGYPEGHEGLP